jgi:hypothetical protein
MFADSLNLIDQHEAGLHQAGLRKFDNESCVSEMKRGFSQHRVACQQRIGNLAC